MITTDVSSCHLHAKRQYSGFLTDRSRRKWPIHKAAPNSEVLFWRSSSYSLFFIFYSLFFILSLFLHLVPQFAHLIKPEMSFLPVSSAAVHLSQSTYRERFGRFVFPPTRLHLLGLGSALCGHSLSCWRQCQVSLCQTDMSIAELLACSNKSLVTAHRFYSKLGGEENHQHNRPEVEFILKPFVAKSLVSSSFSHLPHSAGWIVWFCPAGCCPQRWGGCARGSQLFPEHCFPLFPWQRMKNWVMTSKMLLLLWGVQLSTASTFTLSLFIYFYLIVPFWSCLERSRGKNVRSDLVWCSCGIADQGPPQPMSSPGGCYPGYLHSQKPSPGTSKGVIEPAEQLQCKEQHAWKGDPACLRLQDQVGFETLGAVSLNIGCFLTWSQKEIMNMSCHFTLFLQLLSEKEWSVKAHVSTLPYSFFPSGCNCISGMAHKQWGALVMSLCHFVLTLW